jgi:protein-S-isoprenylcysteine O-methyltransferase Ste14
MHRFVNGTAMAILVVLAVVTPAALAHSQSPPSSSSDQMMMQQQGGMQGMSCCMMGGHPMGMGLLVTLSILTALFLLSASAALIALAIFLLRRRSITPQA